MKTQSLFTAALLALSLASFQGCGTTPEALTSDEKTRLSVQCQSAIADFKKADPDIEKFFHTAYAYAIFPNVSAGALVIGGAHGTGEVYKSGKLDGYADVSKASVGAQIGGQDTEQVVFFESPGTYASFTGGTFELDASASAVAASKGAATAANYQKGVLVFTVAKGGLMASAAVGGQKFRYIALSGK